MKSWLRLAPLYRVNRPGCQRVLRGRLAGAHVWVIPTGTTDTGEPWAWLELSDADMKGDGGMLGRVARTAERNQEFRDRERGQA